MQSTDVKMIQMTMVRPMGPSIVHIRLKNALKTFKYYFRSYLKINYIFLYINILQLKFY